MNEELTEDKMIVDPEEGEILEDGEIADDEDELIIICLIKALPLKMKKKIRKAIRANSVHLVVIIL